MNRLVIITWASASGKTTLQNELLNRWWVRPINFTTRDPRTPEAESELNSDNATGEDFTAEELDEYIFLTDEQFHLKLKKWDFLEHTNYNWNWYGVSKVLPSGSVCIVLDPVWRSQVLEKIARERLDYEVTTVFLDISKELQTERLAKRWDSKEEIAKRLEDFKWFHPTRNCLVLDWGIESSKLADIIDGI